MTIPEFQTIKNISEERKKKIYNIENERIYNNIGNFHRQSLVFSQKKEILFEII